ncbi:Myo-inositol transporter 2 [Yarrowia sp. C11]|nr:Myo-inositol transporter 2 [Yarrowia sp. C11]KAG5364421.1 Myo-inositol transporter 2 [Yarrowia sp. E02]
MSLDKNRQITTSGSASSSGSSADEATHIMRGMSSTSTRDETTGSISEGNLEAEKISPFVFVLVALASISGFLFGYDTGYVSGALVVIKEDLGRALSNGDKELITASTSLGALLGGVIAGALCDFFGRKWVITFANILFLVGAAIQCGAHTVWTMIGGRFVMGWGVGIASLCAPLYISELAPTRIRGRLVVLNVLAITGGQLVAYGIGAGMAHVHQGWRILVGLSMVPAFVQMVIFVFMPETPRYLVRKDKIAEAKKVLAKTYATNDDAMLDRKLHELMLHNAYKESGLTTVQRAKNTMKELYMVPSNLRALIIACGLQGIQQFCGFNSLMYFSATIFEVVGFDNATAVSIIVAGTNFVFTIVAFMVIDRIGRRRILLGTIWGMSLGLVVNAIAFHFLDKQKEQNPNHALDKEHISGWAYVVLVAQLVYVAFYATGIGNVPWQQSELFPISVRGVGTGMATATNWAGSLIVSSTFLTMLENITPTGTFSFYAGLCALGEVFVWFLYPETSGMDLEQIQQLLTGGFNIKESMRLSDEAKRGYKK